MSYNPTDEFGQPIPRVAGGEAYWEKMDALWAFYRRIDVLDEDGGLDVFKLMARYEELERRR